MLLADVRPIKSLFEFYNQRIFARRASPQQLQPAGRSDDLEQNFQELMSAFTRIEVADDVEGEEDAVCSEIAEVRNDIAPVMESRATSTAPSSTTGRSGNKTQTTRGDRARQAKELKGSTRRREDVEDSKLDKAPKRRTKSRKK